MGDDEESSVLFWNRRCCQKNRAAAPALIAERGVGCAIEKNDSRGVRVQGVSETKAVDSEAITVMKWQRGVFSPRIERAAH
jgi:hypothetical protein